MKSRPVHFRRSAPRDKSVGFFARRVTYDALYAGLYNAVTLARTPRLRPFSFLANRRNASEK